MRNARQRAIDGLSKGDRFTIVRTFSVEEIQRFADISRDYNRLMDRYQQSLLQ
jgi:hypothetical protein